MFGLCLLLISFVSPLLCDSGISYASVGRGPVPLINGERRIVVVSPSYNNARYYQKHLDSVFNQNYSNWYMIYIDDNSEDNTAFLVEQYVDKKNMHNKVAVIKNGSRRGALANQYSAIHACQDTDIVILLDADDWLIDPGVMAYLNNVYSDNQTWLTYGQFKQHPTGHRGWHVPMPAEVVKNNAFRDFTHAPGHLRTFYAGLFKKIILEDLLYEGNFFEMTGDIAAMFPMIEMTRKGHFK